jgi:hypothetical protein
MKPRFGGLIVCGGMDERLETCRAEFGTPVRSEEPQEMPDAHRVANVSTAAPMAATLRTGDAQP